MTVMSTDWRATYWLAGMGLVLGTDHQASCSAAMVGLAIEAAAGKAGGLPRCSSLIPDAPEAPSTHNFPSSHAVRPTATCSLPSAPCLLQVFVISLARRPDRRERMLTSLWEMEVSGRVVDAVDGR